MQLSSNCRSTMSKMLLVLSLVAAAMAQTPTQAPTTSMPSMAPSTTPIKAYRAVVIVIVVSCVIGVGMFVMLAIIVAIKRGNACSEHGPCANCCGEQQGAYRHSTFAMDRCRNVIIVFVIVTHFPFFLRSFSSRLSTNQHFNERTTINQSTNQLLNNPQQQNQQHRQHLTKLTTFDNKLTMGIAIIIHYFIHRRILLRGYRENINHRPYFQMLLSHRGLL